MPYQTFTWVDAPDAFSDGYWEGDEDGKQYTDGELSLLEAEQEREAAIDEGDRLADEAKDDAIAEALR